MFNIYINKKHCYNRLFGVYTKKIVLICILSCFPVKTKYLNILKKLLINIVLCIYGFKPKSNKMLRSFIGMFRYVFVF